MENIQVMNISYAASEYPKLLGKSFQVLIVPDDPANLPFMPLSETTGIRRTAIYVRRMASTEEAGYEDFQSLFNRRLTAGISPEYQAGLGRHLRDLRMLYSELEKFRMSYPVRALSSRHLGESDFLTVGNAIRRKESFEEFVYRMIFKKQEQVKMAL